MRADNQLMKKMNRKTLRKTLRKCQTATKPELAAMTGLSVVTTNALIAELVQSGEVMENGLIPSEGGRPSMQYQYNNHFCHVVILYCYQKQGSTFARCIVSDLIGKSVWKAEQYYREIELDSFFQLLDRAFQEVSGICMIAFGLPGEAMNRVVTINDYEKLVGREFFRCYEERYHVPVLFENDVNAMTYGYYCGHRSQEEEVVVGIYFPKRYIPGAGIILNQRIYYGTNHFAGEMARLPVPIPWEKLNYDSEEEVFTELKCILEIFCCTFAPAKVILYGDFLTASIMERLREFTEEFLKHSFCVEIERAESIEKDYEEGLIHLVLASLEEMID